MLSRTLAAVLLGLPLAVSLVGLLALSVPGPLSASSLFVLLWVFPVWVLCLCLPFAAATPARAWAWMLGLGVLSAGLLKGLKVLGWIGVVVA
ncbi:hypothetical protein [Roseateles sp. BYS96W]|uniref:DUF4175 domain-containing protein n=1 Tax=Pelomonas nitida TaxID=3299027 RepID=A0ABW7G874_9BURK